MGSEYNLHKMPKDVTLKDHFATLIESFYTDTLNKDMPLNPVAAQKKTPLQAAAPHEVAEARRRVAQGGGCPPDGHIVHVAFQSQAVFGFCGQKSNALKVTAVPGTDSDWNVVGSRLSQVLIGASADGKDNLKSIVLSWLSRNQPHAPSATFVWRQGHITVHGILKKLPQTRGQIQIVNGELEKVICASKTQYLQEEDLIELLDGTEAFGKGTAQAETCVSAHACVWLGCQQETYVKQMGSCSNGRTRLGVHTFDGEAVRERLFEESFYPKKASEGLLTEVLGGIYKLQHRPCADPAPAAPAAPPAPGPAQPAGTPAVRVGRRRQGQVRRPRLRTRGVPTKQLPQTTPTIKDLVACGFLKPGVFNPCTCARVCKPRCAFSGSGMVPSGWKHSGRHL